MKLERYLFTTFFFFFFVQDSLSHNPSLCLHGSMGAKPFVTVAAAGTSILLVLIRFSRLIIAH